MCNKQLLEHCRPFAPDPRCLVSAACCKMISTQSRSIMLDAAHDAQKTSTTNAYNPKKPPTRSLQHIP